VCVASNEDVPLASYSYDSRSDLGQWKKFSLKISGASNLDFASCHKRKMLEWNCDALLHRNPTIVMQHCPHNVVNSVERRYFKATPSPGELDGALISRLVDRLVDRMVPHYIPFDSAGFLFRKKGRLRARYLRAFRDIEKRGFDIDRDSGISAFVKVERYFEDGKAPRMILGRNPKFNIVYAQIIEPIEKAFFQLDEVANGKDHHEVGSAFSKMRDRCQHFIENDMSKYESSQRFTTLRIEYLVYRRLLSRVCPELIPLLKLCFSACLRSKVLTSLGVFFSFVLCRVSGDLTTGLGNGIINFITSQYNQVMNTCDPKTCGLDFCTNTKCRVRDILVKGDDGVLGANSSSDTFVDYYKNFGLDAKIIRRQSPDAVEFCSGRFVEVAPREYVYVQKLQKLIESLTTCINQDAIRCGWVAHYYKSLGMMYSVVYKGIPVYRDVADFLLATNVDHGLNTNLVSSYNLLDAFQSMHTAHNIDESMAKLGVSLANDMDYAELDRISAWMRGHRLCFPPEMTKRCNTKKPKLEQVPVINFSMINHQISLVKLHKDQKCWFNKLDKLC